MDFQWGILLSLATSFHAHGDSEEWFLMFRHGECHELSVLEKKVSDIDGIDNPTTFSRVMRERGYGVMERAMPEVGRDTAQVHVAEKGLFLSFVKASLCETVSQGKGHYGPVLAMASDEMDERLLTGVGGLPWSSDYRLEGGGQGSR